MSTMTFDFASKWLRYDPDEGRFYWRRRPSQAVKAGSEAGYVCSIHGYRRIRLGRVDWHANKLAILLSTGEWPNDDVDHINGDKADDRISNLRVVPHIKNMWNTKTRKDNATGLKGAFYDKRSGSYRSAITVFKKKIYLGSFKTAQEAHDAYCAAATIHFGEHARFE